MAAGFGDVRVGVNPIVWSNDDFHELGGDIALERCLAEMRACGYAGTELGHKFPRQAPALAAVLAAHDLALVSGWHSLHLLERPLEDERRALRPHLDLLAALGCRVAIVAECSRRTYTDRRAPLAFGAVHRGPERSEWARLARGLETLAEDAARQGLVLVYHPHAGTVIQERDEIETLLERTSALQLVLDTGHLALAGIDPLAFLRRHAGRVRHVHLKDVRGGVASWARAAGASFADAVGRGVFAVPGDGGVDFASIYAALAAGGYTGWLVVEAEQDPAVAPPRDNAQRGRAHVRAGTGL